MRSIFFNGLLLLSDCVQDLRSFLVLIKYYDENDVIISVSMGFQRAYKAPNQRYECHLGIHRLPFLRKS